MDYSQLVNKSVNSIEKLFQKKLIKNLTLDFDKCLKIYSIISNKLALNFKCCLNEF
jgi:hypothetical protein